ncbi:MAG: glycerophosphodiester phosphodiesterase [Planctomycetota bacterium]
MKIVAHRGAASVAPENTLESVGKAIALGADAVEVDVRVTADAVPVLIHDADLIRTHGVVKLVEDHTYKELEKISRENGAVVPTLDSLFAAYGGKTDFIFEIKDAAATMPVIQAIASEGYIERAIIACANLRVLRNVRSEIPEIKTGFIVSEPTYEGFGFSVPERVLPVIDVMMPYWRLARHHFLAGCRRYALQVYAWLAVFDEEEKVRPEIYSHMAEIGVDALVTMRPDACRASIAAQTV